MSNVFDDAVDAVASQWRKANGGGFLTTAGKKRGRFPFSAVTPHIISE
jgi:hypothetical protein